MSTAKTRFQRIFLILGAGTLLIYVAALVIALLFFRVQIRVQIVERTGDLLSRFSQHQFDRSDALELEDQLLDLALSASELEGIIALRLFYPPHNPAYRIPFDLVPATLTADDQARVASGLSTVRFYPALAETALFLSAERAGESAEEGSAPHHFAVVEVLTPLRDPTREIKAGLQYWLDGKEVLLAYRALDHHLIRLGSFFMVAGAAIYLLLLLAVRRRLLAMAREIQQRNESLQTANRELDLLARSAALGSMTGHLFHGLKNPLASLKAYLRLTGSDNEALQLTDRIQTMINETLAVLNDNNVSPAFMLTLEEILETLEQRFRGDIEAAGCRLDLRSAGTFTLSSRQLQLLQLILRNLIDNALQASQRGAAIALDLHATKVRLRITVTDQGCGIPATVQAALFQPLTSAKSDGTGLGLVISSIIARHIPARLKLDSTSAQGTVFSVEIDSSE